MAWPYKFLKEGGGGSAKNNFAKKNEDFLRLNLYAIAQNIKITYNTFTWMIGHRALRIILFSGHRPIAPKIHWPRLKLYLCICISVFAHQTLGNFVFEVLVPLPFQKYNILEVWGPVGPRLLVCGPSAGFLPFGHLNFVLRALRLLRPCDPRTDGASGEILMPLFEKYKRRNESAFLWQRT